MEIDQAWELGKASTIFGYALVDHYKALWSANSPQSPRRALAYKYTFVPRLYGPDDDVAVTANNGTIYGFLRNLSFVMQWHEFASADGPALKQLSRLGVKAGEAYDKTAWPVDLWAAFEAGFATARAAIGAKADNIGPVINGWSYSPRNAGHFGMDYLVRSATAWKYILFLLVYGPKSEMLDGEYTVPPVIRAG